MNRILLSAVAIISMTTASMAQTVPNYVPTNGLVGWWPFNGNANDESGNGNNLLVNGNVNYANDRYGNPNASALFNGNGQHFYNDYLNLPIGNSNRTFSFWFKLDYNSANGSCIFQQYAGTTGSCNTSFQFLSDKNTSYFAGCCNDRSWGDSKSNGVWHHGVLIYKNDTIYYYRNDTLINSPINNPYYSFSTPLNTTNEHFVIGTAMSSDPNWPSPLKGNLDDICIWNRDLTRQEISDLYNAVNCNNNLTINPQTNNLQTGNNAVFTASTSDVNPTYVWQSDFGQGFQTLNDYGTYSGATTNTLTVSNVQLTNHLQPFRVIATSGICVDTSVTAYIQIADTCVNTVVDTNYVNQTIYDTTYVTVTDTNYVTIYDTVTTYISVTDTLFIDINTVGLNNNPVVNTIKVFPNPSNSILNLNYGNYATLNNYRVKITNALGQTIYDQAITQQSETLDLSTFGGNGIYYLSILNPQGNVVEIRKIVLQ